MWEKRIQAFYVSLKLNITSAYEIRYQEIIDK